MMCRGVSTLARRFVEIAAEAQGRSEPLHRFRDLNVDSLLGWVDGVTDFPLSVEWQEPFGTVLLYITEKRHGWLELEDRFVYMSERLGGEGIDAIERLVL